MTVWWKKPPAWAGDTREAVFVLGEDPNAICPSGSQTRKPLADFPTWSASGSTFGKQKSFRMMTDPEEVFLPQPGIPLYRRRYLEEDA